MDVKVTILMPNYNNEDYIVECLDSILNQTYKEFTLLIVDDGSTDSSLQIIESYDDSRIKLIKKFPNSGIVDALNIGLENIETEYMIRHDGDDVMHPDRVGMLVEFMDQNPHIGICGSNVQYIGDSNGTLIYPADWQTNEANLIFGHSIAHASCIFRTSIFKDTGIRYSNEYKLMEDYDLFYRLKNKVKTTSIPDFLYLCRLWERNAPAEMVKKKKGAFIKFYTKLLEDLEINYDNGAEIHFELVKDVDPSHQLIEYINHLKNIEINNKRLRVYPPELLAEILQKANDRITLRLISAGKVSYSFILTHPKLWRYAFGKARSKSVKITPRKR